MPVITSIIQAGDIRRPHSLPWSRPCAIGNDGHRIHVGFWRFAAFRGDATIWTLSERSGHSVSCAYETEFMSTRPSFFRCAVFLRARRLKCFAFCLSRVINLGGMGPCSGYICNSVDGCRTCTALAKSASGALSGSFGEPHEVSFSAC